MSQTIHHPSPAQAFDFFNLYFGKSIAKRYVFAINEYAEAIAEQVDIDGYIDDFTPAKSWKGKPVFKLSAIASDSLIISCVTASYPTSALLKLQAAGIRHYMDYFSLADASQGRLPQVQAIAATRQDYEQHAANYRAIRQRLHDETSRDIFDLLLDFRRNGDLRPMRVFEYAADRQYFEPFLGLGTDEIFVDGGGFDGYTSLEFARRCPDFAAIHVFEPSAKMLAVAREKLAATPRVTFHQLGLYNSPATLSFDASEGSASRISESGSDSIEVAKLDDVVGDKVTLIKLDLEGAELAALQGARQHILDDHPKLAIAVYHQPADFWQIPEFILGLRQDYTLHLRHYTEGWTETVMFFIPA